MLNILGFVPQGHPCKTQEKKGVSKSEVYRTAFRQYKLKHGIFFLPTNSKAMNNYFLKVNWLSKIKWYVYEVFEIPNSNQICNFPPFLNQRHT